MSRNVIAADEEAKPSGSVSASDLVTNAKSRNYCTNTHVHVVSRNIMEVTEVPDVGIIMPDGCRLSARIWKPARSTPVPAILEFLPYRKRDGTAARDALTHPYLSKHGYACIRVDTRGNGDSEGIMEDEYSQQELDDAFATISWISEQPWCTGKVGMMGISWGGFNSLQVAAMQPPALQAIITICSTADRFSDDIHYKGGCLLNENMGWGSTMYAYSSRPPDPALVGEERWRDAWLQRLRAETYLPITWLEHQTRDDYWKHGSVSEDYSAITASTLAIGGWGDAYKNTVSRLVENLTAAGAVKGIVGPWVHKYPHLAGCTEPRIGFLQEALRWWDKWLKDIDTGVENDPQYSVYLMEGVRPRTFYEQRDGVWISENNWPKGLSWKAMHFGHDGCLLHTDGATAEKLALKVSSPQHCGLSGGEYCAIWLGPELPGDQRRDDAFSLCFTSEPLEEALAIVGAPKIHLRLSADRPKAQITVRLNHIFPDDGAATRITYGVLNLCHRNSHAEPELLPIGEEVDVSFSLDQIAYRVPKGHKVRVALSTNYWPLLWPSPETAVLTVTSGTLDLPLRASGITDDDERSFAAAESGTRLELESLREASNSRRIIEDMNTGLVTLEILDDFGKNRDKTHGLVSGSVGREWWIIHPDDPLSAHGKTHWTTETAREGWSIRTETFAEMTSDKENYFLTAKLEAYENDQLVFGKDVCETISRHFN